LALQRAKSTGKAQAQWVATGLEATLGVANMESLRNCLLDGSGVWAVSQQVMDLRDGRPIATEFLARGPRGFEMPDQILALAREMNILTEVDRQCLRRCIERSYAIGIDGAVHVNVLPSTIAASDPRDLIDICRKTAAGRPVVLEMSHHWIPGDAHELVDRVNTLREGGLSISLDHVGYGRTSLEALLALSPDIIKTDRRLTGGVGRDPRKAQMLRRLADMVSALGATLVALGLENDDDVDVVRNLGIDFGQGLAWGEAA
ncbi:EAL domain-containing protein, partial [bacterium]|nr:EAL domain-containing protein [bacterium]